MSESILKYVAPSTSTAVGESAEDVQSGESRGEMPEVSSQEASYVKVQELEKIILSSSGESDVDEGDASRSLHQQDSDDDEEEEETVRLSVYSDVAAWPVADVLRVDLIKRGSEPFQNRDEPFSPVERQGEKSKGLFAVDDKETGASSFVTGFQLWWKLNPKVSDHEASEQHLTCLEKWKTLRAGLKLQKCLDHVHQTTVDREKRKWKDILHRLLDVTLFLAHQNLPFRGHRETMSSANKATSSNW
ncbi:Hypothetical predicted protein [Pelobates cultripes]|uniref:Uncharacterized protein n=1 Tax=Pelobates cultripes TaxID=61616 RepID=A0AAD1RBA9_PELCU|nr:Hypothetical predicted protein [Pelobates cultripes]